MAKIASSKQPSSTAETATKEKSSSSTSSLPPLQQETWWALFVVGIIFPVHIVIGLCTIPFLLFQVLYVRSLTAMVLLFIYLPFYFYPAQVRYPGWKGFESLWRLMDFSTTASSYFGRFEVHGAKENIDPEQQYFMACHPHGVAIFQRMFFRSKQLLQHFNEREWRMLSASILFRVPIVREMSLWFGGVEATRSNVERLLRANAHVVVWPGGLDEANHIDHPSDVYIRSRTGFIRLAIKHNVPVLPVFVFGELDALSAFNLFPTFLANFIQKTFRASTTGAIGRWNLFIPRRVPFDMCIGKPVPVERPAPPPQAMSTADDADCADFAFEQEVLRMHEAYKQEIRSIYAKYKDKFGYGDRRLVFLCEEDEVKKKNKQAGQRGGREKYE